MNARILTMNLKPNHLHDFTELLDKQVIPMLRKQTGFRDLITFVGPSQTEIRTISFWEKKENAESYASVGYPEVLKALNGVIEGVPQVKSYEIITSTLHKLAMPATV